MCSWLLVNERGPGLGVLQIYSVANNTWFSEEIDVNPAAAGNPWTQQFCYLVNNKLFVFGGSYFDANNNRLDDDGIYKYEGQWSKIGALPYPLRSGVAVYYKPYIYLIGGISNKSKKQSILIFDPVQEQLTENTYLLPNVVYLNGAA
eukprot:374381_1